MRALLLILPFATIGFAGCSRMENSATLDYDQLRGGLSPVEVRALPPKRPLTCKEPVSGRGLSVCEADVTELDGLKAARLTYVFQDDKLLTVKAEYSAGAFDDVARMMDSRYKRADETPAGEGVWRVANGAVISSAADLSHGNVYTYWLSTGEMKKAGVPMN